MWWKAFKYIFAGGIFWLIGALFLGSDLGFMKRSEPADLIVLQLDTRRGSEGYTMYRPVFGLETDARPRPEYSGNTWMRFAPHQAGEIVSGRYDPESGEMRSNRMMGRTTWAGRIARILGILSALQGFLMFFGVPELLLPLRIRFGR